MYYAYAAFAALAGWDNILAVRLVALAFELGVLALVYSFGKRALSPRAGTIAVAANAYAIAFDLPPEDALALNGELILLPLVVVGAALAASAMAMNPGLTRRASMSFAAGAVLGAAACIKPTAALQPLPIFVWMAVAGLQVPTGTRSVARDACFFTIGLLAFPLTFVTIAARQGTLARMAYYCVTYNATVHLRPMGDATERYRSLGHLYDSPLFLISIALAAVVWVSIQRNRLSEARPHLRVRMGLARFGVVEYLWLQFLCAIAPAAFSPQCFFHYFLIAIPFWGLLVGWTLDRTLRHPSLSPGVALIMTVIGTVGTCCAGSLAYAREKIDGRVAHDAAVEMAAAYIARSTLPTDRIFVWGFSPWLYEYSHRRPAGRYVFSTFVTGFVPWFWSGLSRESARVAPHAMDDLIADLDTERPALVVDAGSVMISRPLRAYAPMAEWLHRNYCFDARVSAFDVYRRLAHKRAAETWSTDDSGAGPGCDPRMFPLPASTVDYFGKLLDVPTPAVVDADSSRPLSDGHYFGIQRFSDCLMR